jgi:hypothetical protein
MVEFSMRQRAGDVQQAHAIPFSRRNTRNAQELPRRETSFSRQQQESLPSRESAVSSVSSMMQYVAAISVAEIDDLVTELERLRNFVQQEHVRLQGEVEGYARVYEEATKSTKIIAESVQYWKEHTERHCEPGAHRSTKRDTSCAPPSRERHQ